MDSFYQEVIKDLIQRRDLDPQMRVLVLCGGGLDREVMLACGLTQAVISNLDSNQDMDASQFAPLAWSYLDAERIDLADESVDFCVAHSGLHHCESPHRALLEMYRVARRGVVFFEPYDNWVTRMGVRLGFGQEYEHAAVFYNDCRCGGVRNTAIPNFVYRWTHAEIRKTIQSRAPHARHEYRFYHRLRIPWGQIKGRKNPLFHYALLAAWPLLKLGTLLFPRQSNNFAAVILKPELPRDLHPWLQLQDGRPALQPDWLARRYGRVKSPAR
jgi:ubiquinone/menaquinone biosynthesis C-methylase UbiE